MFCYGERHARAVASLLVRSVGTDGPLPPRTFAPPPRFGAADLRSTYLDGRPLREILPSRALLPVTGRDGWRYQCHRAVTVACRAYTPRSTLRARGDTRTPCAEQFISRLDVRCRHTSPRAATPPRAGAHAFPALARAPFPARGAPRNALRRALHAALPPLPFGFVHHPAVPGRSLLLYLAVQCQPAHISATPPCRRTQHAAFPPARLLLPRAKRTFRYGADAGKFRLNNAVWGDHFRIRRFMTTAPYAALTRSRAAFLPSRLVLCLSFPTCALPVVVALYFPRGAFLFPPSRSFIVYCCRAAPLLPPRVRSCGSATGSLDPLP